MLRSGPNRRRRWIQRAASAACVAAAPGWLRAQVAEPTPATLAIPGPGSSVSLILELASKIGADRAESVALLLKFVSGGGIAIREILTVNAQFSAFGVPAAMQENLGGPQLVAMAAIEERVPLSIMVRVDLKDSVRQVEDRAGEH
jgi:hypothetical protein